MTPNHASLSSNQRVGLIALALIIGGNLLAGLLTIPLVSFVASIAIVVLIVSGVSAILTVLIAPKRFQQRFESVAEVLGGIAAAFKKGRDAQPES